MSLSTELRKEFVAARKGRYAPEFFRNHGIRLDPDAPITELRTNMVYTLFTDNIQKRHHPRHHPVPFR